MTRYAKMTGLGRMALAAMAATALLAPAAMATTSKPLTFRALEHRHSGNDRLALAHRHFNERIPAGSSLQEARATLQQAGARCSEGERLSCTHNSYDGVSDMLHQVVWTVDVSHQAGTVTKLDIHRQSIGS